MARVQTEIVGAVGGRPAYGVPAVRELLATSPVDLDHDGTFTGRPTTIVHAGTDAVLKRRRVGPADDPRRTAAGYLARERELGVHPPGKTWFVHVDATGRWIGNVAPRLTPLHLPAARRDPERFARHLATMLRRYVQVAARFRVRLDEGLSNFAYDDADTLHYVDDDLYEWDDFAHLGQALGVTIRRAEALDDARATEVGRALRGAVVTELDDPEPCGRLADAVRAQVFPDPAQQRRRDAFLAGLRAPAAAPRRPGTGAVGPMALLADVHANAPALTAVLADVRALGIERGIVLGDLVGYGPHPAACLRMLRETGFEIVRGNHDEAAATGRCPAGFNRAAFEVIEWTRRQLSAADLAWLGRLPVRIERDGWRAQHGAPIDPTYFNAYVYRMTYEDNLRHLAEHGLRLAFHGHTHVPSVYHATGEATGLDESPHQSLYDHERTLVCPGAVGQPRRGGTAAQWAVFDPATGALELRSAPYDLERTVTDMEAYGLPATLAERLRAGR